MKKTAIITLLIAAFLGGFLIFYQNRSTEQNPPTTNSLRQSDSEVNQTEQQANNSQKWETKTDEQANIAVAVTPLDLSPESAEWKFNVVMDTHSVELDQDLIKNSLLIDDGGNEFKPIKWDGPTGGHHREGVLTFNRIMTIPKSIELKIIGTGDVVRSFAWQLK